MENKWIKWVDPEVGMVSWECPACGQILVSLDHPRKCPCCRCEPVGVVSGEV